MSSNEQNDLDGIFREKLDGLSVAPPPGMWNAIATNTKDEKRRRVLFWVLLNDSTLVLLFLLFSFFTYGLGDGRFNMNLLAQSESKITNENELANTTSHQEDLLAIETIEPSNAKSLSQLKKVEEQAISVSDSEMEPSEYLFANNGVEGENGSVENVLLASESHKEKSQATSAESAKRTVISSSQKENTTAQNYQEEEDKTIVVDDSKSVEASMKQSKQLALVLKDTVPPKKSKSDVEMGVMKSILDELTNATTLEDSLSIVEAFLDAPKDIDSQLVDLSDTTGMLATDSIQNPIEEKQDLVGAKNHEIFAGLHGNINAPVIFNQNTYGAFDGKELAYKPTFGFASGVRLGYTYKKQYGVETGFIFYSKQGQDYDETLSGHVVKKQVKLQYMQVPLVFRYKFKEKKEKKISSPWVVGLGMQVDILQSAKITYEGNEFPLAAILNEEDDDMDYFKSANISAVLSIEKEIYFTKFLFLGVGVRTTFSSDINAKNHPVENDGNYPQSHNFTFGLKLSLNYYLRK